MIKGKRLLPLLFLSVLLSACAQSPATETPGSTLPPADDSAKAVETPQPTPSEAAHTPDVVPPPLPEGSPLTLAGEELLSAVLIYDHTQAGGYVEDEEANLEELFTTWGFSKEEPFYECWDNEERPLVKLWYDEKEDRGLGFRYEYDTYRRPKTCFGFGFTEAIPAEEDRSKVYWHHWHSEPTTSVEEQTLDSQGRTTYERRYITHGHLDYFYIYDGDEVDPAYCLWLDANLGTYFPEFICF